jgi:diaminopropionate ammonia-lyase
MHGQGRPRTEGAQIDVSGTITSDRQPPQSVQDNTLRKTDTLSQNPGWNLIVNPHPFQQGPIDGVGTIVIIHNMTEPRCISNEKRLQLAFAFASVLFMTITPRSSEPVATIAAQLLGLSPSYAPTPLLDLPRLAGHLGVGQMLAKNEGLRMLGSFKSLGGTYAGLRALARAAGLDVAALLTQRRSDLPTLICASDGNHGLAVAAAAKFAGGSANIFLHRGVGDARARRIEAQGARIVWVDGSYDDAVDQAAAAARNGSGILVADTTDDPNDLVVSDVMAGYGVMAAEIRDQIGAAGLQRPTHLFVQAGVGGLAAAMADGLKTWMASPAVIVVVEPERAACVSVALAKGRPERITGQLDTAAEMLACGEASARALAILRSCGAMAVTVSESDLAAAPRVLHETDGPATTPSGAAGLSGAITAMSDQALSAALSFGPDSRALILVTEGALHD